MIELPKRCLVNKFIPKKTFYEKLGVSTSIKDDFVNIVDKIIWLYKLSEDTLGIVKTKEVEEIEVFEISLKEKKIPKNVIRTITRGIPYKILFVIKYNSDICYGVKVEDLYFSEWNEELDFNFDGLNLETIFENLVKTIIKETDNNKEFSVLIDDKSRQEELSKKIEQIKSKIKQEKQFNKKVELNQQLRDLEGEMEELINE